MNKLFGSKKTKADAAPVVAGPTLTETSTKVSVFMKISNCVYSSRKEVVLFKQKLTNAIKN